MKKNKTENKEVQLFGIINSLEWDKNDNILSIEISTEEEDYVVEPDDIGKDLFDCVGEEVEVTGIVTKGKDGENRIKVVAFEVLDYDEDDDDDDYYDDDDEDDDDDEYFDYDDDDDDDYDDADYDDDEEKR
jgi:hypothetical protein